MDRCVNCKDEIHTPDDRTGVIHKPTNLYSCVVMVNGKEVRQETVAE